MFVSFCKLNKSNIFVFITQNKCKINVLYNCSNILTMSFIFVLKTQQKHTIEAVTYYRAYTEEVKIGPLI